MVPTPSYGESERVYGQKSKVHEILHYVLGTCSCVGSYNTLSYVDNEKFVSQQVTQLDLWVEETNLVILHSIGAFAPICPIMIQSLNSNSLYIFNLSHVLFIDKQNLTNLHPCSDLKNPWIHLDGLSK